MMVGQIDALLRGTIDTHVHTGPDTVPRRVDPFEAAREAEQAGMRAIVLKNHSYCTSPLAQIVGQAVQSIAVFGSICLDYEIGGLNYHALRTAAKLAAKIVWMPTFSAANSRAKVRAYGFDVEGDGFSILDSEQRLVPEVPRLLALMASHNMVLATGHLAPNETFALVDEAVRAGVRQIVVTHPADTEAFDQALTIEEQRLLAAKGALIEQTFIGLLPGASAHKVGQRVEMIKEIGPERCIMSTDLGQHHNPPPAEGMRMFISTLLRNGVSTDEIELMAKVNPAKLLGLD